MTSLAPYAASEESSRGRIHAEDPPSHRTEYQRDRDRIIHSASFRRLVYKAQVFVNHERDHYRTRLTHSLEVAQIARTVARSLRVNEDLAEAISLAHDLGHTPFGHAGQDALDRCMRAYGGFEHNLQSLRLVDRLEQRYAAFRGLNLTFEAREGLLKHCSASNALGLGELGRHVLDRQQPGVEAQLANLADEIAYNTHDMDDGLRSGLIRFGDLREVAFVDETLKQVEKRYPVMRARQRNFEVGRAMIGTLVSDLITASGERLRRLSPASIDAVRSCGEPLIGFSPTRAKAQRELKAFLRERLYRHPKVREMSDYAEEIVTSLFSAFREDFGRMPDEYARRARQAAQTAGASGSARVVADYIAGHDGPVRAAGPRGVVRGRHTTEGGTTSAWLVEAVSADKLAQQTPKSRRMPAMAEYASPRPSIPSRQRLIVALDVARRRCRAGARAGAG